MNSSFHPKIVFSDIDGTFLRDDHTVSPRTKAAVLALRAQGIPFVLVSARMPEAITPITRGSLGIEIPMISYSGAFVLDEAGKTLLDVRMDGGALPALLGRLEQAFPAITVNYYAGRHWYVRDTSAPRVRHEEDITDAHPEAAPASGGGDPFLALMETGVLPSKILLMGEPVDCERAEKELAAAFPAYHVVRSAPNLVEIMQQGVSKESGIRTMLAALSLKAEDALSFGDNYNDLEMLRFTGTSVAMGNAPAPVQAAATDVTLSNEDDGIWYWLVEHGVIAKEGGTNVHA